MRVATRRSVRAALVSAAASPRGVASSHQCGRCFVELGAKGDGCVVATAVATVPTTCGD